MRSETRAALEAVGLAQRLVASRDGAGTITSKGGRDLATATDVNAEDVIRTHLTERYPDWVVVGEERGGQDLVARGPHWLVDPICGTRNFASDIAFYCVNVALVEDGLVTLAVVGDGTSDRQYVAERGRGARLHRGSSDEKLAARDSSDTVSVDVSGSGEDQHQPISAIVGGIIRADSWYVRMLGSTLAFALVADGRLAAHVVGLTTSPVHTAAGCLVAQEAGAYVTDFNGSPWDLDTRSFVVASTKRVQERLLALIDEARKAARRG